MTDTHRAKTAAVVVTYNRKELLDACLESLLNQTAPLDAIYIIDNYSTDGTYDALLGKEWIAPAAGAAGEPSESIKAVRSPTRPESAVEIRYVRMPENTGGAGGFHEGVRRGCAAGFDWLWLMDDDLRATPEAFEALLNKREALVAARGPNFLLNSLVLAQEPSDGDTLAFPLQEIGPTGYPRIGVYYHRLSEVADKVQDGLYRWACPFNGTLIPTAAIAEIGLPNKDFFIWGDERDFLWRAAQVLDLYTVVDSRTSHPKFPGVAFNWKLYYHIRNALVINERLNFTVLRDLKLILAGLALGLRHGTRGLGLVGRAIKDGLTHNLGPRRDLLK